MSNIRFLENAIEIKQYEFQSSNIRTNPLIKLEDINEVNLNTSPASIVINHNEVIFIDTRYKQDFIKFVREKKLKVENRFDIWEAINEDFLDTEFTHNHKQRTLQQLNENGFSLDEVKDIRSKIEKLMDGWASVSWEWMYLGHYDLLLNKKQSYLLLFPKDFYWWTMDIALRNYKKK